MNPPTWLDERGRLRAKRPCPQCGREIPVVTLPPEHLKWYGWQPWQLWSTVEWCGHRVEGIPVPDTDGRPSCRRPRMASQFPRVYTSIPSGTALAPWIWCPDRSA